MSLDSDILVDRRRIKRSLTFWRVAALIAIAVMIAVLLSRNAEVTGPIGQGAHIARIRIDGFIGDSQERHDMLVKLRDSPEVKAVIVRIDSPGGTTTGGEALYEDLRQIAEKKPVAAVFGTAATSAAYMSGIATDYIVARGNTITGSVGVIFQWPDLSQLLDKIGVKVEETRSGPLKATPSLFAPADERTKALTQQIVQESMTWFTGLVTERRKAVGPAIEDIKTGRIYTGREALKIGLIDAIGDEKTALKWMTDVRKVEPSLKVLDWHRKGAFGRGFMASSIAGVLEKFGVSTPFEHTILNNLNEFTDRPLDGLLSVWHG